MTARTLELMNPRRDDAELLAVLSHRAKLTYRVWAPSGWHPPALEVECARWTRRLSDPGGWTMLAQESGLSLGTIHIADARTGHGRGDRIAGVAHLSDLFVAPDRWGERIGTRLLDAALAEMRARGYSEADLFTAEANAGSRAFYGSRGWQLAATGAHEHDGLWLVGYRRPI